MPQVIRGVRSNSDTGTPGSPAHDRRVTFENGRQESFHSLQQNSSHNSHGRPRSERRGSSHRGHEHNNEESQAYYDSRAASQKEFKRRASNLQAYYDEHPDLLPQLPFTFRRGFKRWRLGGYIALMVFDACVVPILLYYALTFGGKVQGYITFAVITAIWGGPTYVEFGVRSLRLIKQQRFYKPLGVDKRWAFDITNWILVLTIASVTALLIVGAAPHDVFLRVLSMPGPAILYCLSGPIFLMSMYNFFNWQAPFRISSTHKGEKVLPGIYYIVEDIVAVNSGGGRPFREAMAARYKASPIFRRMLRDLSWFWSVPGLIMAGAITVPVVINPVPEPVSYGLGWAVPFIWAAIWAAITVPWVRKALHRERVSWEEESNIMSSTMNGSRATETVNKHSEEPSTSGDTVVEEATEGATVEGLTQGDSVVSPEIKPNDSDVHESLTTAGAAPKISEERDPAS